jgi:glutathione peroxidase
MAFHDFETRRLDGTPASLGAYRGKVALVVNTASECGLTPQYEGLQKLHEAYGPRGLAVLGFPSNDFGAQEPGTAEQIQGFCQRNYGVGFDMFEKVPVKGEGQAPLYAWLTDGDKQPIQWNFEKFLIGKDGTVLARFAPNVVPEDPAVVGAIEEALSKG